jgi:hypothetical protein
VGELAKPEEQKRERERKKVTLWHNTTYDTFYQRKEICDLFRRALDILNQKDGYMRWHKKEQIFNFLKLQPI